MNELLLRSIEFAREQTLEMAAAIKDADFMKTAAWAKYHPAWILGHIDMFDQCAMQTLEPVRATAISRSTGSNIYGPTLGAPFMYRKKEYYVQRLAERVEAYARVLSTASPRVLAGPVLTPELKSEFKCIGDVFAYVPYHEAIHQQQLLSWFHGFEIPYELTPKFKP
jgi:hypothetical protein